jgi:hypothetical protein
MQAPRSMCRVVYLHDRHTRISGLCCCTGGRLVSPLRILRDAFCRFCSLVVILEGRIRFRLHLALVVFAIESGIWMSVAGWVSFLWLETPSTTHAVEPWLGRSGYKLPRGWTLEHHRNMVC